MTIGAIWLFLRSGGPLYFLRALLFGSVLELLICGNCQTNNTAPTLGTLGPKLRDSRTYSLDHSLCSPTTNE